MLDKVSRYHGVNPTGRDGFRSGHVGFWLTDLGWIAVFGEGPAWEFWGDDECWDNLEQAREAVAALVPTGWALDSKPSWIVPDKAHYLVKETYD